MLISHIDGSLFSILCHFVNCTLTKEGFFVFYRQYANVNCQIKTKKKKLKWKTMNEKCLITNT